MSHSIPDHLSPDIKEVLGPVWQSLDQGVAVPLVGNKDNHQLFRVGRRGGRLELWTELDDKGLPQVHVKTWNHILGGEENSFILPPDRGFIGRGDWSFRDSRDQTIGHHQLAILKDEESGNFFLARMSVGHIAESTKIAENIPSPVHAFGATSRGRWRHNNEDALFIHPAGGIYLVCDGVGKEKHGEIASRAAVTAAGNLLKRKRNIPLALSEAHQEVLINGQGGATTIVGAVETQPNNYEVFNLGDSPAYLIDLATQTITKITEDHVSPNPDPNKKPRLSRALGMDNSNPCRRSITLNKNQFLLLCTDGLSDYFRSGRITAGTVLEQLSCQPINTAVVSLVTLANHAGGKDNITAVLVGHHQ